MRGSLRWYEDPEIPSDQHPILCASLPELNEERFQHLCRVIDDANLVLLAAPRWVLVTPDFDEGFLYADLDEDLGWSDS